MIRIHQVYGANLPADRLRVEQVQALFRANFAYAASEAEKIPALLDDPFRYGYRTILLVSENARSAVTGFSLFLHFPEVNSSFLDYLAVRPGTRGGGLGSALYEATREYLAGLGSRGLYIETLPDDPALIEDPAFLKENRRRLRFYEGYGLRPIVNTDYDRPAPKLRAGYLLFDGLGRKEPLGRDEARAAVRLIIKRKHGKSVTEEYIERVVDSFTDDPVRFRPPRAAGKTAPPPPPPAGRLERPFARVSSEAHTVHLVHQRGYVERPVRVGAILEGLEPTGLFAAVKPRRFGEGAIREVHNRDFVNYLKAVCRTITGSRPVYPYVFPIRRPERRPKELAVRAGYYCVDTFTPLDRNAYRAARAAVDVVLTAMDELLGGRRVVYAICRPPGHHAGIRTFGGFCYFNNAAVAGHQLSKWGKAAVLDLDYHHGNGTQDIFYRRDDVLTISLHGHPAIAYPHFSGFADERGEGEGTGYNRNYPLPAGSGEEAYLGAFDRAVKRIGNFRPAFLVVSLGLDTLRGDPTGSFLLTAGSLEKIGRRLGGLKVPILVVQEGGYSLRNLRRGVPAFFTGLARALAGDTY
ncbi:MAG: histone deacetylase family protein [Candidatus Erginobacter occultus]|nr:histone deacetylase family protein [Candidatus Erginobacter occultus]